MKARRIDFSPGDWIGGTFELSLEEEGLYIRICALIWSRGERITEELLKASTRTHGNRVNALLDRLESKGKIVRQGSEIGQKRAEKELENAEKRIRKASENGAKGGRPNGLAKATGYSPAPSTTTTTTKKDKNLSIREAAPLASGKPDVPAQMTAIWNEECSTIAVARKPSKARAQACKLRWHDEFNQSPDEWRAYCRRIAASAFLRGEGTRGWRCNLDWVLKQANLTHIMEGNYDDRLANGADGTPWRDPGPSGPPPRSETLFEDDGRGEMGIPH